MSKTTAKPSTPKRGKATPKPADHPMSQLATLKTSKPPKADPSPKRTPGGRARAPAGKPGHYTSGGHKKHQTNGPVVWSQIFLAAARKASGPTAREGEGVRLALEIGVAALAKQLGLTIADPAQALISEVKP